MICHNPLAHRAQLLLAVALLSTPCAIAQCGLLGIASDSPASTTSMKLWDINKANGVVSNPRVVSTAPNRPPNAIDFSPAGVLYGVSQGSTADVPPAGKLFTINPTNGAASYVADLTQFLTVEGDIAFDPITGTLYAVTGVGALFTIHTTTGLCTSIGNLPLDQPGGADYSGLAFDSAGELYVWSTFGPVVRHIDKSNATVLSTAVLAPSPGGAIGGMAFDPMTGTALLAGGPGSGAKLSTTITSTGVVTPIGPLTGMNGVWAITFDTRECATVGSTGTGCVTDFASFYESLSAANQDLIGMVVTGTKTSSGYVITTAPGSVITLPTSAVLLPLSNDDSVAAGTLGLHVGSNGWLARGPGNSIAPIPTVQILLNQPSEQVSAWTDLDPSDPASGLVYYDEPGLGIGRVTYDGVIGTSTFDANFIQITWDTVLGDWSIEYGALSVNNPQVWLTGYSPAGPNLDPGPSDISTFAGNPHSISQFDVLPLTLTAIGRPVQGFAAVNFDATSTNIEPTALLHIGFIGLQNPNLPLSIFGLPADCFLHASVDIIVDTMLFPGPARTWTTLTLPALPPSVSGFVFHCQSATFDSSGIGPATRVSNGLRCVVGLH